MEKMHLLGRFDTWHQPSSGSIRLLGQLFSLPLFSPFIGEIKQLIEWLDRLNQPYWYRHPAIHSRAFFANPANKGENFFCGDMFLSCLEAVFCMEANDTIGCNLHKEPSFRPES